MQISLYKSYGVLGREKEPVYTWGAPASEVYDTISAEMPEIIGTNEMGEPLVDLCGTTYRINDVLSTHYDAHALRHYDGRSTHYRAVREIKAADPLDNPAHPVLY